MSNRGGFDSKPSRDPGPSYTFNPSYISRPYVSQLAARFDEQQLRYPVVPSTPPPSYHVAVLRTSNETTRAKLVVEDRSAYDEDVNVFRSARHRSPVPNSLSQTRNTYRYNDSATKTVPSNSCLVLTSLYSFMIFCLIILGVIAYALYWNKHRTDNFKPIVNETVPEMFSEKPNFNL